MAQSNAYDLLVEIQHACENNYLKFSSESAFQWQGVIFTVGQTQFITPIWQVAEIVAMPSVTTIPGLKSFVKGVAQVRGELILMNDLGHIIDGTVSDGSSVLIIEKNTEKVGFIVTKVDRLMMVKHKFLVEEQQRSPFMKKILEDGVKSYPIIDFKVLMEQSNFIQVRMPA